MGAPGRAEAGTEPLDRMVARLAGVQHGLFARAQLRDLGLTRSAVRHRLEIGRWEQVAPDVFQIAGARASWRKQLMAACLAWGTGASASHRAAIANWEMPSIGARVIELWVPRKREREHGPGVIHRGDLDPRDVTVAPGIPTTTVARTLIDFAAVAERNAVEVALDAALHRRLVSLGVLRRRVDGLARRGRQGTVVIRELVEAREATGVSESVMETMLLQLMRESGLPEPVQQHPVFDGPTLIAVSDFAYPDAKLAIEADGYRYHSTRPAWERDRARANDLPLQGWRIIHVTWPDLTLRPAGVAERIRRALGQN